MASNEQESVSRAGAIPFAMFRHNGETVSLTEERTISALRSTCACGACLDCRAKEYVRDVEDDLRRTRQVVDSVFARLSSSKEQSNG